MKEYWAKIKKTLAHFCRTGDQLHCSRIYKASDGTCEMCGHTPIVWHHVLVNSRTGDRLTVGSECIRNCHEALGMIGRRAAIVFRRRLSKAAHFFNERSPGTVQVSGSDFECDAVGEFLEFEGDVLAAYDQDSVVDFREDLAESYFEDLTPEGLGYEEVDWKVNSS